MEFDSGYYRKNKQDSDRPALWFYTRLARRYIREGRILDFGCGTGHYLKRLSKYFKVEGFDPSPYAGSRAMELVPQALFHSQLTRIPRNRYSGITVLHVLEHMEDSTLHVTLELMKQALVPGGRILCVVPELEGRGHALKNDSWCGFRDPSHINLKTSSLWIKLFREVGFTIVKAGTDGLWDFPYTQSGHLINLIRYAPATLLQFLLGRLVLPVSSGESLVIILEVPG
jgi:SAM-dependent methyltransferase